MRAREALNRDVMEALHKAQPGVFKGEGPKLAEIVEAWIESMDEYFNVVGSNERSKIALGRLKVTGNARNCWKNGRLPLK